MPVQVLPFEAFLDILRNEGFAIGVDSWLRLADLLEKSDGGIHPGRLKTVLSPLVATSPEEQHRFSDVFDRYYTLWTAAQRETGLSLASGVERGTAPSSRKRWWRWLGAAALVCALLWGAVEFRRRYPAVEGQSPKATPGVVRKLPTVPDVADGSDSPAVPPSPVHVDVVPVDTSRLDRLRLLWSFPAALLAIYALWYGLRRLAGGYLVRQGGATGSWSRAVAARVPIAPAPKITQNVRRLRRRIPTVSNRLDVVRTVESTIRHAGFPQFRFHAGSHKPEYLVLIDRISARDHEASLFHELVMMLREKGQLAIDQYFFTRDPRVCVSAKTGTAVYLADLLPRHTTHRMLIFGDGSALWSSLNGERASWAGMLLDRPHTALLTPVHGRWSAREHALSEWILVREATLEGLSQVLEAFEERPEAPALSNAGGYCPEYPAVESKQRIRGYLDSLREYLGAHNFELAAACALYPRLEWDLTLHLAAALDAKLLDYRNLLKIAALPWFRKGFYPVSLQQQLFECMRIPQRRRLQQKIIELIEQGAAGDPRQASLEVIVQRFDLSPVERQRLAQDETFARLAMTAGRSRLALRIPEPLRRALFRSGVPAFGLRMWAFWSFAGIALSGVIAAAIILPPVPSMRVSWNLPEPPQGWIPQRADWSRRRVRLPAAPPLNSSST